MDMRGTYAYKFDNNIVIAQGTALEERKIF